ncbi:MAG: tyrosine-type recombinase/integrase [Chloroflexi bacterium]|nr:tyrosine-type recombinase/integrase [Chloroflexota bacterium]
MQSTKSIIDNIPGFLEYLDVEKGLSVKSQETYGRFISAFAKWLTENKLDALRPHELSDDHVWKYRYALSRAISPISKEPLKRSTQNHYLIALRAFLSYFIARDIESMPPDKVKLAKKAAERIPKVLQLDQVEKMLLASDTTTITGLRDRAILESLFSTGMRIAELVALDRGQVRLMSTADDLEISIIGKGGHARTVYFSSRAVEAVRQYLAGRHDKEKALFIGYRGVKRVPGKRITPRAVQAMVKKYSVVTGCPLTTTPHVFRHSFATDLLNKGVDIRMVQEFLGHRNIATTQVYTHVTSKRLRDIHRQFHSGPELKE